MREIKFRAKSRVTGEWLTCALFTLTDPKNNKQGLNLNNILVSKSFSGWIQAELDMDTLGQFTGLKDKNGKDIYEGDIICYVDGLKRVNGEWIDNKHIYVVEYSGAAFSGVAGLSEVTDAVEVIGNIFDNPELNKFRQV